MSRKTSQPETRTCLGTQLGRLEGQLSDRRGYPLSSLDARLVTAIPDAAAISSPRIRPSSLNPCPSGDRAGLGQAPRPSEGIVSMASQTCSRSTRQHSYIASEEKPRISGQRIVGKPFPSAGKNLRRYSIDARFYGPLPGSNGRSVFTPELHLRSRSPPPSRKS